MYCYFTKNMLALAVVNDSGVIAELDRLSRTCRCPRVAPTVLQRMEKNRACYPPAKTGGTGERLVIGRDRPGALPGFRARGFTGAAGPPISERAIIGLAVIWLQKTARTAIEATASGLSTEGLARNGRLAG
jgi:hypothetical protein